MRSVGVAVGDGALLDQLCAALASPRLVLLPCNSSLGPLAPLQKPLAAGRASSLAGATRREPQAARSAALAKPRPLQYANPAPLVTTTPRCGSCTPAANPVLLRCNKLPPPTPLLRDVTNLPPCPRRACYWQEQRVLVAVSRDPSAMDTADATADASPPRGEVRASTVTASWPCACARLLPTPNGRDG